MLQILRIGKVKIVFQNVFLWSLEREPFANLAMDILIHIYKPARFYVR